MSIAERLGADHVSTPGGTVRVLSGPPLIAPARSFVFPLAVAGEEDALARGALWLDARPAAAGSFLAQCALGFATAGVAHGLWPLSERVLAVAGGYAYALHLQEPQQTVFLPLRPVVGVLATPERAILVGYHALLIVERDAAWQSPRVSWEGITLTGCDGDVLHGIGWDMMTDEELPFALDLRTRALTGGGYRVPGPPSSSSA